MTLLARIFSGLGVFLIAAGIAYGLHSGEYEGDTEMIIAAGGALLIGGFLAQGVQRARVALDQGRAETAESEPHVGPTIWPLVFSIAMIVLVVGAVGSHWVLIIGALLSVAAAAGWVLDVQRQWHHHFYSEASPDPHGSVE